MQYIKTSNLYFTIPGVYKYGTDLVITTDIKYDSTLSVNLYDKKDMLIDSVDMTEYRRGSYISSVTIPGAGETVAYYELIADGVSVLDEHSREAKDKREWGTVSDSHVSKVYCSDYDWGEDLRPCLKASQVVSYLMHVRGFSMQDSSVPKSARGTFRGITAKIKYLSELGINQVILMPSYDFDEVIVRKKNSISMKNVSPVEDVLPEINYWGYTTGCYYRPKASYCAGDTVTEFKDMVNNLHQAGIEVIMQLYFPAEYRSCDIIDIMRFWAYEYHVDGFYLVGENIPGDAVASDRYLADIKIIMAPHNAFGAVNSRGRVADQIYTLNNDFSECMRRYLKSDTDMLRPFIHQMRYNPSDMHTLNYITSNEGFTLKDLVSYDFKHNEANGEDNRDGNDYNFSWNCGVEGPTRKKSINSLRNRQIRNALMLLMTAQGTPMLFAGDEIGNTQDGNNNAYCQDNKISYLDWKKNKEQTGLLEFTSKLINFRKVHGIMHMPKELRLMDYLTCGYPDLSYHADDAWRPRLDNHLRHIGIMLCGEYATSDNNVDDFLYMAYNMHWESHDFALPKLPAGYKWELEIFTGENEEEHLICEKLNKDDNYVTLPYRSVAILKSVIAD